MNSTLEIDKDLFCEMMKFYGETLNLPPLSAKIYSYLIFDFERKGICFEEFVEVFSASKSSVSSNLNLLLNANLIIDFTKINERKRFFTINENYIQIRFTSIINRLKREVAILDKINAYRKSPDENLIERFENYKTLLNKNIQNIEHTLHKI
ncbi:transcriptional regulator [Kaistella montana]|uniref:Transcriptional regulator n=1 Tax=Kaistella montana TaxID=1849733 RepID=A0ABW5KCZ2_9FLAO|nr:transcriptional regulator [Kaistella montana]MCQ4035985.1 transcriptional regulator [Kaistella montana]